MSDCREMRALLSAYHDGELPPTETARVAEHLTSCASCAKLLAAFAEVDSTVESPDPGPEYWASFNARVEEKLGMEPKVEVTPPAKVLTPKRGWGRKGLPYFIPAVAAAALLMVVVRHGAMDPRPVVVEAPAPLPAVSEKAVVAESAPPSQPTYPADALSAPVGSTPSTVPASGSAKEAEAMESPVPAKRIAVPSAVPPSTVGSTLTAASTPVARTMSEREAVSPSRPSAMAGAGKDVAASSVPSPAPPSPALADSARDEARMSYDRSVAESSMAFEKKEASREARNVGSMVKSMSKSKVMAQAPEPHSACDDARRLAVEGRLKEAEAAQRACLVEEQAAAVQEKGLVFLAELLDRQGRFADADAVLGDTEKQFPRSRPLDEYLRQRPEVQRLRAPVSR